MYEYNIMYFPSFYTRTGGRVGRHDEGMSRRTEEGEEEGGAVFETLCSIRTYY